MATWVIMSHGTQLLGIPPESMLSFRLVRSLADAVERAGANKEQLLQEHGFPTDTQNGEELRVSRSSFYRLCESAVALTGDPAFGLHWSERLDANAFNPLSHLVAHAGTLGQAFEAIGRYHRLFSDWQCFSLDEADDLVVVRCMALPGEAEPMQRFMAEAVLGSVHKLISAYSARAKPKAVCFAYPAPDYQEEYTRFFGGTERFDQSYTGLIFERALLDTVSPHKDDDVHAALRSIAEQRMVRLMQRTPYALRVREHLVTNGPTQRASMSAVARGLGISVRSLRRRLEAEGTSYNTVVNESLGILAKQLIRNNSGSVQEIAFEMGFADTSSFHRAFKRWTGMTPRAYRAEQMGYAR
jgi:AraC-like DNA-binding protein